MEVRDRSIRQWLRQLGQLGSEAHRFAQILGSRQGSVRLFVLGSQDFEPWHFTAHIAEEADRTGRADLSPTLLRWAVPRGAPTHLSISTDHVSFLERNQTLLVVSPYGESDELKTRVDHARKRGARVLSVQQEGSQLSDLSHDILAVESWRNAHEIEVSQHLVTSLAPAEDRGVGRWSTPSRARTRQ